MASFSLSFSSCSSCILNRLVSGDCVVNGLWWKPACSPSNGFVCINWASAAGLSRICGGNDWIIFEMLPANPYCAVIIVQKSSSKAFFSHHLPHCSPHASTQVSAIASSISSTCHRSRCTSRSSPPPTWSLACARTTSSRAFRRGRPRRRRGVDEIVPLDFEALPSLDPCSSWPPCAYSVVRWSK